MDILLTMSNKELTRLEVMQRIQEKRLTQKEAAHMLGLSIRHVRRLYRAYRNQGAQGLVSQRRGKPSNNRLDPQVVQQTIDLIYKYYRDFGPTLAHEKLTEVHKLRLSRESVRRIMIEEGIWKPKKARKLQVHQMRERRACFGELVQIDGSEHAWFEERGPKCTLIVFVDDATGQLGELRFVPVETFFAYCEASRHYFERFGKPVAFYTDKHGIFQVNQPSPLGLGKGQTQFERAMQELDIQIMCANSPQAKGRIERANKTLQDRLVKELRLRGISSMQAANEYMPEFREDYNRRFAVVPRSNHDAHRPLPKKENLDLILSRQETRILSRNLTIQYRKVIYQIQTQRPTYALVKAKVTVCENAQGEIKILYRGRPLDYTVYQNQAKHAQVVSSKSLDHKLKAPTPPAKDHPWRRYGLRVSGKPISDIEQYGAD
jgi:transposase